MKPIIQKAHIFDDLTGQETDDLMFEVLCGKCNEPFGLSTGDPSDTCYYQEHYHFCNKCGEPVDW